MHGLARHWAFSTGAKLASILAHGKARLHQAASKKEPMLYQQPDNPV